MPVVIQIQVPDSIINTAGWFCESPNLKKWMLDHDIEERNILQSAPFKAKVAKGHHPVSGLSDGSQEEGIVTVADVYEALTSKKRSYKTLKSKKKAIQIIDDDIKDGIEMVLQMMKLMTLLYPQILVIINKLQNYGN